MSSSQEIIIDSLTNTRLANLCGQFDENLRYIEKKLSIEILSNGNNLRVIGDDQAIIVANRVIKSLYELTMDEIIRQEQVHFALKECDVLETENDSIEHKAIEDMDDRWQIQTTRKLIRPRSENQNSYLAAIMKNDLSFGIGPAGTGKTYLAVASAIKALEDDEVRRIILVRPAVEAGENLGFLPGDMSQKVDLYFISNSCF